MQPKAKVLVVDDDQPIADFISEVLDEEGYQVHSVIDAHSVLAELEAELPDVVQLDLRMPGIDGFDLFRLLAERGLATMPIILMTEVLLS